MILAAAPAEQPAADFNEVDGYNYKTPSEQFKF